MSHFVKLCLLLGFFALVHADAVHGLTTIEASFCARVDGLKTSIERAKRFFRNSVYDSVNRIRDSRNPIQVDLYILAHYLMYQKYLRFESDPEKARALERKISDYFLDKDRLGVWLSEGCLATKVLTGLRQLEGPQRPEVDVLVNSYSQFVLDRWKGNGVGECFSPGVERTYGVTFEAEKCTPPTTEQNAKLAFYLARLSESEAKPFAQLDFSALNDSNEDPLVGWWDTVSELWVIKVHNQPGNRFVSDKRFEVAKNKFAAALRDANPDEPQTIRHSLIVYGALLAGLSLDQKMLELVDSVRSLQAEDGRLPSHFKVEPRLKDHNIDATPTYFYLLAVREIFARHALHSKCVR